MSSKSTNDLEWRIYYSDGSLFDNTQGTPQDAPSFGVICIVQVDKTQEPANVGRTILSGWDWYYFNPDHDEWWGSDIHGVLDRALHSLPICHLKQGRNAQNNVYREIMRMAANDPGFPRKSGLHKTEHPGDSNASKRSKPRV